MTVVWSERSKIVYLKYIDQTLQNYSVKLAREFIGDTDSLITKLRSDKELCPPSKIVNLRKCIININISMVYRLSAKRIEIVTFLFNRSVHKY